ncbi:hypothetical protein ACFL5G_03580 [Candidatus Margulisiibacteriota bacterium]
MLKHTYKVLIVGITVLILNISADAAYYSKVIYGKKLVIQAPVIKTVGRTVIASSGNTKRLKVYFMYEKQLFWANRVVLKNNKISLQNGFWGSSRKSSLAGDELVYNLRNNYFDGENIEMISGMLKVKTKRLFFYGEKIEFAKARIGLHIINLGLDLDDIQIFPGWIVIRDLAISSEKNVFYRIPAWVIDMRRNAFQIPYPLPQFGSSIFRGNYGFFNTHYYWNEHLYGFARIGSSQYKGPMVGFGQIVRFSDQDQLYFGGDFWQWKEAQGKVEYNHSLMDLPYKKRRPTFGELLEYNKEVRELDSSDIRATYTKREEINDEEIDRDMEAGYKGHFGLTKKLDLDLSLASGHLYEYSSEVHAIRTNSDLGFTYEYPLGWLKPLWWGFGYNRSDYDEKPYTWQRVYGTMAWEKDWKFVLLGIKYTHYFYDKGGSPFVFDQKYTNPNNIVYNLRLGPRAHHLGAKFLTNVRSNILVDTTYYLGWTFSSWLLQMQYSTQREAFSMGLAIDLF